MDFKFKGPDDNWSENDCNFDEKEPRLIIIYFRLLQLLDDAPNRVRAVKCIDSVDGMIEMYDWLLSMCWKGDRNFPPMPVDLWKSRRLNVSQSWICFVLAFTPSVSPDSGRPSSTESSEGDGLLQGKVRCLEGNIY
uniref:Pkinase_Tyr domain-containing protein n=1 Tax=Heterorhabditis bacteriophora TaxID=37862 RepID=A0A1I7X5L0_HETBA